MISFRRLGPLDRSLKNSRPRSMSIVKETAKDFRQATIRVIVTAFLPTLVAMIPLLWTQSREWMIAHTTKEQIYYIAVSLFGLFGVVVSWLVVRLRTRVSSVGDLEIVSAQYGSDFSQEDVTPVVRGHVQSGTLNILATTGVMGVGDPLYGRKKELTIICRLGGIERTFHVPEGRRLIIP